MKNKVVINSYLNYKQMKRVFILLVGLSIIVSAQACNSNTKTEEKKSENGVNNSADKQEKGAIHLTKDMFLKKVMDYEKNPEVWKYLGDKPAIIDFYADWCMPCRKVSPVLEEIAKEYDGKIYVYKINTEKERELASLFGIQSIPAFLFIPMNGQPQMSSGIARTDEENKQMFKGIIDEFLLGISPKK